MVKTIYSFIEADSKLYPEILALRHRVFFRPHGLPPDIVRDELEEKSIHLAATLADRLLGYARLNIVAGTAIISQMVVEPGKERQGLGTELIRRLMSRARTENVDRISLAARLHAVDFYEKFGFIPSGRVFPSPKTGVPHVETIHYFTTIKLRPFTKEDLKLWDTWTGMVDFSAYQTHLLPDAFNKKDAANYIIFIIESESESIGAIWLEDIDAMNRTAWLGLFIGYLHQWNKGIGHTAIHMIVKWINKNTGLEAIYLNVRENNRRAIACYEKAGFIKHRRLGPKKFGDGSVQGWYEMVLKPRELYS